MLLSLALIGLATWHIFEYIKYQHVMCEGSLKLLTKRLAEQFVVEMLSMATFYQLLKASSHLEPNTV